VLAVRPKSGDVTVTVARLIELLSKADPTDEVFTVTDSSLLPLENVLVGDKGRCHFPVFLPIPTIEFPKGTDK
jgi:hypothetical protein